METNLTTQNEVIMMPTLFDLFTYNYIYPFVWEAVTDMKFSFPDSITTDFPFISGYAWGLWTRTYTQKTKSHLNHNSHRRYRPWQMLVYKSYLEANKIIWSNIVILFPSIQ